MDFDFAPARVSDGDGDPQRIAQWKAGDLQDVSSLSKADFTGPGCS